MYMYILCTHTHTWVVIVVNSNAHPHMRTCAQIHVRTLTYDGLLCVVYIDLHKGVASNWLTLFGGNDLLLQFHSPNEKCQ